MRESRFIEQNRDKWREFEAGIADGTLPADKMERAYVELNEDLAYARTFYRNRAVRLFLNNLILPVYNGIYKGKKWTWKSLSDFFTQSVPQINFEARKYMLISFVIVMLGFAIGYFSTRYDVEFAEVILGNDYVAITEQNISKGDPLAIYKSTDAAEMFYRIAGNNLKVAAYFFLFGALFCMGAMYLLLSNGIMLGAFTWMFTSRGLSAEYFLTVYQHGTLEILGMVIEGAAGIMLGAGIFFPGTLSRSRSMQSAAKKSISIFLVCVPIIILAAFIESYLTRFTEIPNLLRATIIFTSLAVMLYYFLIFPMLKYRKSKTILGNYDQLLPDNQMNMLPGTIHSVGKLVLLSFNFVKNNISKIVIISLFSLLILYNISEYVSGNAIARNVQLHLNFNFTELTDMDEPSEVAGSVFRLYLFNIYSSIYFFSSNVSWAIACTAALVFAIVTAFVLLSNRNYLSNSGPANFTISTCFVIAILVGSLQFLLLSLLGDVWVLVVLLFFPLVLSTCTMFGLHKETNKMNAFITALGYCIQSLGRIIGLALVGLCIYFVTMFGIMYLFSLLFLLTQQFHGTDLISPALFKFYVWVNYVVLPLLIVWYTYMIVALSTGIYERQTAWILKSRIKNIRLKTEVYGVETE